MNKIEAIIRPERLSSVKKALAQASLLGFNVVEVAGRGMERGVRNGARGTRSYELDTLPRMKLELVVSDKDTQKAIDAIMASAWTGSIGDGKIFVIPVARAIRLRNGEQGERALLPLGMAPEDRQPNTSGDLVSVSP